MRSSSPTTTRRRRSTIGVADIVGDSLQLAIDGRQGQAVGDRLAAFTSWPRRRSCSIPTRRAHPRQPRRLLAGDPRSRPRTCWRCAASTRCAGRDLRQHLGGGQGGDRALLHLVQRADIVNAVEGDTVIMIPDQFLAQNTAKRPRRRSSPGPAPARCTRPSPPPTSPNCATPTRPPRSSRTRNARPTVIEAVDFSGSTPGMINWVKTREAARVVMVTELDVGQPRGEPARDRIPARLQHPPSIRSASTSRTSCGRCT